MSVPVNKRIHGKLEACVKAHGLCCYTLQITENGVNKLKIIINRRLSPKERARLDNAESKLAEEVIRRTELEDAVIELGSLFAEQDDAIVELAEMITEV